METKKEIRQLALKRMKIMYDDDVAIIDFIADLQSWPLVLPDMEKQMKALGSRSACLLYRCDADNMVILILYNSPFGFNEGGNTMILYADNTLRGLIKYFKNQLEHTSPEVGNIYHALNDITQLLYWKLVQYEEDNTQTNFMG